MLPETNMEPLKVYCLVGAGSALGGMGRLWVGNFVGRRFGETFPWGTLLVNITGSILIGVVFALMGPNGRWTISPRLALFLMSGVCGGYTTFSAFSLQTFNLLRQGDWWHAGGNVVLSVALCVAGVVVGHLAGLLINR
jgi:fluoride exporter